ncbi:putative membrane protein [Pseudoxanthomonas sp. 3HH-4]|uniref:DMT family transporter n=1 Tax=Pseudoxanthomonas sp. 3HH-4 TaxID=1690214 RepID=UPI001150C013|nr:DMT family transporter [Pseudoxanthomonas sp. 3HH-4]TQM17435.1 putative membrane protein [Pseudoxanthomonas sp. 3HH-4]
MWPGGKVGIGEAMALGSAAAWAVGVILARQLGAHLPPLTLNLLKNGLVLCLLAPVALPLYAGAWPSMPVRELLLVLASGVIGIALADTLYFRALNELGAGRMGVIGNLYSPLVLLLGFVFLDERLGGLQWLGFLLVAGGVLLVSMPARMRAVRPAHTLRGILLGVLAIALMAIAIVMVKRTLETQPLLWVTLLRLCGAMVGLLFLASLPSMRQRMHFVPGDVAWHRLVLAALVGQGLSMVLWLGGYKFTSASVAAILNESASVFLVVLAALWLREPMGRRAFAGVLLTFSGIACMLLGRATP